MQPTYTPVVAAGRGWLDVELADAKASCSRRSRLSERMGYEALWHCIS